MTTTVTRRLVAAAAAVLLAGSLAGCSQDEPEAVSTSTPTVTSTPTSAGSPSPTPQVCRDIVQARVSLVAVTSVPVLAQGRDAITAQWDTAKADVNTAIESARGEFPDEADALADAVEGVQTAVDALEATPSAEALAELGRAVVTATTAITTLDRALRETC